MTVSKPLHKAWISISLLKYPYLVMWSLSMMWSVDMVLIMVNFDSQFSLSHTVFVKCYFEVFIFKWLLFLHFFFLLHVVKPYWKKLREDSYLNVFAEAILIKNTSYWEARQYVNAMSFISKVLSLPVAQPGELPFLVLKLNFIHS